MFFCLFVCLFSCKLYYENCEKLESKQRDYISNLTIYISLFLFSLLQAVQNSSVERRMQIPLIVDIQIFEEAATHRPLPYWLLISYQSHCPLILDAYQQSFERYRYPNLILRTLKSEFQWIGLRHSCQLKTQSVFILQSHDLELHARPRLFHITLFIFSFQSNMDFSPLALKIFWSFCVTLIYNWPSQLDGQKQ